MKDVPKNKWDENDPNIVVHRIYKEPSVDDLFRLLGCMFVIATFLGYFVFLAIEVVAALISPQFTLGALHFCSIAFLVWVGLTCLFFITIPVKSKTEIYLTIISTTLGIVAVIVTSIKSDIFTWNDLVWLDFWLFTFLYSCFLVNPIGYIIVALRKE